MKKNKRKNILQAVFSQPWLIVNAVFIILCSVVFLVLVASLKKGEVFTVKQVIIREKDDITSGEGSFAYFKGMNIFGVDLDREAARIAFSYPSYRKIRLTRFLPDCILVDFLRRRPVAALRGSKQFFIDDAGVLFNQEDSPATAFLPVIAGLDRKLGQSRAGRRTDSRELALSLQVIKGMREEKGLKEFTIREIDVGSAESLSFILMPAGIEVKMGSESIPAKLQILSTVLAQMRTAAGNIKYIDLRFKEPVIKFKTMEKFACN